MSDAAIPFWRYNGSFSKMEMGAAEMLVKTGGGG